MGIMTLKNNGALKELINLYIVHTRPDRVRCIIVSPSEDMVTRFILRPSVSSKGLDSIVIENANEVLTPINLSKTQSAFDYAKSLEIEEVYVVADYIFGEDYIKLNQ